MDLFTCPRQPGGLRLTTQACGALWRRAGHDTDEPALNHCRGCDRGAVNAVGSTSQANSLSLVTRAIRLEKAKRVCIRCGSHGHRLIGGAICVSCYNREREVIHGRNRRGSKPLLARQVFSIQLRVGGRCISVAAASLTEAVHIVMRQHPGEDISWPRPSTPAYQRFNKKAVAQSLS